MYIPTDKELFDMGFSKAQNSCNMTTDIGYTISYIDIDSIFRWRFGAKPFIPESKNDVEFLIKLFTKK